MRFVSSDNLEEIRKSTSKLNRTVRELRNNSVGEGEIEIIIEKQINELGALVNPIIFGQEVTEEIFNTLINLLFEVQKIMNKLPNFDKFRRNNLLLTSFYYFLLYNLFSISTDESKSLFVTAQTLSELLIGVGNIDEIIITKENFLEKEVQDYLKALENALGMYAIISWSLDYYDLDTWKFWVNTAYELYQRFTKVYQIVEIPELIVNHNIPPEEYSGIFMQRFTSLTSIISLSEHILKIMNSQLPDIDLDIDTDEINQISYSFIGRISDYIEAIEEVRGSYKEWDDEEIPTYGIQIVELIREENLVKDEIFSFLREVWVRKNWDNYRIVSKKIKTYENNLMAFTGGRNQLLKSPFSKVYVEFLSRSLDFYYSYAINSGSFSNLTKLLNEISLIIDKFGAKQFTALFLKYIRVIFSLQFQKEFTSGKKLDQMFQKLEEIQFQPSRQLDCYLLYYLLNFEKGKFSQNQLIISLENFKMNFIQGKKLDHIIPIFEQYVEYLKSEMTELPTELLKYSFINYRDPATFILPNRKLYPKIISLSRVENQFL